MTLRLRESDMYPPIRAFFERRGYVVLEQYSTGIGRVDILAAKIHIKLLRKRTTLGIPPIRNARLLAFYRALSRRSGWQSISRMAKRRGLQLRTTRRYLLQLQAMGLASVEGNRVSLKRSLPCVIADVAACEAKVADWRGAVRQVRSHHQCVTSKYIALPRMTCHRVDPRRITKLGIGMIFVDGEVVKEVRKPKRARVTDQDTLLVISERVFATVHESSTADSH